MCRIRSYNIRVRCRVAHPVTSVRSLDLVRAGQSQRKCLRMSSGAILYDQVLLYEGLTEVVSLRHLEAASVISLTGRRLCLLKYARLLLFIWLGTLKRLTLSVQFSPVGTYPTSLEDIAINYNASTFSWNTLANPQKPYDFVKLRVSEKTAAQSILDPSPVLYSFFFGNRTAKFFTKFGCMRSSLLGTPRVPEVICLEY